MKTSRRFITEQVIANVVINFFIAYYLDKHVLEHIENIPMFAPSHAPFAPNMAGNILVGSFILSMLVTLIVTPITRYHLRKQHLSPQEAIGIITRLPEKLFKRSMVMGLAGMFTLGLISVLALFLMEISQAPASSYVMAHAVYAALLAAIVAFFVTKRALADV